MQKEKNIIEAVMAGQVDEYEYLVVRYQTGLIIHCERLVQDRDQAEDIAQEAFVKAYQKLDSFDAGKGRFSTWLYRIATNMALDHLRVAKRRVVVDDLEKVAEATQPTFLEDDDKATLRRALEGLEPPKYVRLIEAYYWHGLSYSDLANEFSTTTGTIGTWMMRAKAKLRKELE